jgi:EPS-associated MarR family transcriptional regulator
VPDFGVPPGSAGAVAVSDRMLSDREETSFRVLRALEHQPQSSQRDLARQTRVSLGAVNYCLQALQAKGLVKAQNFRASDNKLRYMYVLTPQGLAHRVGLTSRFLARKLAEYDALQIEIDSVKREIDDA